MLHSKVANVRVVIVVDAIIHGICCCNKEILIRMLDKTQIGRERNEPVVVVLAVLNFIFGGV